jgi:NAD(P)-dependent dehydrogenase (short-subunit alcohol dehydrogenase family)
MEKSISELFSLEGKVALITGGAGWLGSVMAESLAQAGAKVVIIDCKETAVAEVTGRLKEQGLNVAGAVFDVMNDKPLREGIDIIAEEHGRIDVLVNCAVVHAEGNLDEQGLDDFRKAFGNSAAYAIAAQQVTKYMRKTGGGSIINIGSMYGLVTSYPEVYEGLMDPAPMTYGMDKAAVIQMTRYMAIYWAKEGIRVNCLSPGAFPNADNEAYVNNPKMSEFMERLVSKIPLGRIGKPAELKGALLFLASDASSYVTGQNMVVDGGWTVC